MQIITHVCVEKNPGTRNQELRNYSIDKYRLLQKFLNIKIDKSKVPKWEFT